MRVSDITRQRGFGVVEHHRPPSDPRLFPPHDTTMQPGDGLILQGPLYQLEAMWQENLKSAASKA